MHPYLNIAINAARQAGNLIVRYMDRIDELEIKEKNHTSLVSSVDVAAEKLIIETILKNYPQHGILAEECGEINAGAEIQWVIDPLDGTMNYLHGFPHFAISIAIKIKNRTEHGLIYDPLRQEIFSGSRGRGAQLNARRVRVSEQPTLNAALIGSSYPFKNQHATEKFLPAFQRIAAQSSSLRRSGCSTLDLAYVAAGRLDGYWGYSLRNWDMAAGVLLIKEAGGLVTDFSGSEQYAETGNIVAANRKLTKAILKHIA